MDSLERNSEDEKANDKLIEDIKLPEIQNEGGDDDSKLELNNHQNDDADLSHNDSDEESKHSRLAKSNTSVRITLSTRVKPMDTGEPPDSPLPVIKINDPKADADRADDNTENLSKNNISKVSKPKKKHFKLPKMVNLKAKYDGFNRLRFIYPRVIPKLIEERDLIIPCQCKQVAHRCCVMIYCLLKKSVI